MGSGLSMASVNKIKELANSREYSLALDIIDSQDLSKSLNPQFLRLCGEIYTRMGRYREARETLVMAHRLAPEAKRIIYSFVELYLRMGYMELADTYYNMYLFDADENGVETKQVRYIHLKAAKRDLSELEDYIAPVYSHSMDYEWSFETFLVYVLERKMDSAGELAEIYTATYKNSDNSRIMRNIIDGNENAEKYFDIYSKGTVKDDAPEDEDIRTEERKLLDADELRMHPKEAEITIIFDDSEDAGMASKLKFKKLLKEREKEELEREQQEREQSEAEPEGNIDGADDSQDAAETKKTGLFKKVFLRKKKASDVENETETAEQTDAEPETETAEQTDAEPETEAAEQTDAEPETETAEQISTELETETVKEIEPENAEAESEISVTENMEVADVSGDISEVSDANEGSKMREIHIKQNTPRYKPVLNPIVSVDLDDDFTAETDTVEGLRDDVDYENPFDSISAIKKDRDEYKFVPKRKTEITFEDAEISPEEPESEYEVDDFTVETDSEFGEMEIYEELEPNQDEEPEIQVEAEPYIEEEPEAEEEIQTEAEHDVEEEPEVEEEIQMETEPYIEEEPEAEEEIQTETEHDVEEEPEAEEEIQTEIEPDVEEEPEAEEEIQTEAEPDVEEEPEVMDVHGDMLYGHYEQKKKKLDFPVFKSSLFPEYNQAVEEVENNFNEIMTEAQDKFEENKRREEQMLKEAEELLASMGIHLEDVNVTSDSMESIGETLYDAPSRDELKASLKIDYVKKDILRKLKENR